MQKSTVEKGNYNFRSNITIDWCPGCGDFGIVSAVTQALSNMKMDPNDVVAVSGIGCSGKTPHYLNIAGVHTLHGRAIPYAVGVKLANPKLNVLVMGGDGDLLSIGAGHFVGEGRRNSGVKVILYNNGVYGLTKGQAAPTLPLGEKVKSLPRPNILGKINPITLAMASGYSFVARAFSSEIKQLSAIIERAIKHDGSAIIEVLQPCPTYNDINTLDWYRDRVYKMEDEEGWNPVVNNQEEEEEKFDTGYRRSMEWGDRIPTGIFYENNTVPSYTKRLSDIVPNYIENPPASQIVSDSEGYTIIDPVETFIEKKIE
ncbi:MAG: 2-oxoacid:ferredoxin oxidoreductase subunit beta [Ferroplasma sp.]